MRSRSPFSKRVKTSFGTWQSGYCKFKQDFKKKGQNPPPLCSERQYKQSKIWDPDFRLLVGSDLFKLQEMLISRLARACCIFFLLCVVFWSKLEPLMCGRVKGDVWCRSCTKWLCMCALTCVPNRVIAVAGEVMGL